MVLSKKDLTEEQVLERRLLKNKLMRDQYHSDPATRTRRLLSCKKWREAHPEESATKRRKNKLRLQYGMTEDQYAAMYAKQEGACELCKTKVPYRKLAIDHSHKTGIVRGLLCGRCNRGLGLIEASLGQHGSLIAIYVYLSRGWNPAPRVAWSEPVGPYERYRKPESNCSVPADGDGVGGAASVSLGGSMGKAELGGIIGHTTKIGIELPLIYPIT